MKPCEEEAQPKILFRRAYVPFTLEVNRSTELIVTPISEKGEGVVGPNACVVSQPSIPNNVEYTLHGPILDEDLHLNLLFHPSALVRCPLGVVGGNNPWFSC